MAKFGRGYKIINYKRRHFHFQFHYNLAVNFFNFLGHFSKAYKKRHIKDIGIIAVGNNER
jgi:hypothetical protein